MKIHIHAGVHKTATSFIQGRLKGNLASLNRAGIGYMPVQAFRNKFTTELMNYDPSSFNIENHLTSFFPRGVPVDIKGLIISEENLPGHCGQILNSGKMYLGARKRLMHLRRLLKGHDITLFGAFRRYDSYLTSCYCEGLRLKPEFITFDNFIGGLTWKGVNWFDLLARFEGALEPEQVRVWRYEDFRDNADTIMQELAFGLKLANIDASGRGGYFSLSQIAVDALALVSDGLGGEVASALVRPISETFSKGNGYKAFDPWQPEDKIRLAAAYDEHCQNIPPEKWLVTPLI